MNIKVIKEHKTEESTFKVFVLQIKVRYIFQICSLLDLLDMCKNCTLINAS